jgi:hypothetical protein
MTWKSFSIWAAGSLAAFVVLSLLFAHFLQQDNSELTEACRVLHAHALTSKGC